ncbi:MAG: helix-turn-helix transcriptional regulator [Lachnospiraceae bacterium]|nr:helix-turn-helix transcriptional regulator [Lachnospiraceae bacterium]
MNRIAELRKEKKISQISLGMELNVSQKMISAYENEKNEPGIQILKEMARLFNTSIDYLVGYSDIRQPLDILLQSGISQEEAELLHQYRKLTREKRLVAQGVLLGLNLQER